VSGHVTDARTGTPLTATIELTNVTFSNGEGNASGGTFGAYHMFLPPGTYDVRFSAPGYNASVKQVTVTSTSATVLNVQLTQTTVPPPAPQNLRIIQSAEL
jgi:Carboxypeptidase regulatory-like domain